MHNVQVRVPSIVEARIQQSEKRHHRGKIINYKMLPTHTHAHPYTYVHTRARADARS